MKLACAGADSLGRRQLGHPNPQTQETSFKRKH